MTNPEREPLVVEVSECGHQCPGHDDGCCWEYASSCTLHPDRHALDEPDDWFAPAPPPPPWCPLRTRPVLVRLADDAKAEP